MANKGQKFQKHSVELKEAILKEYFSNFTSPRRLGEKYGISRKTIENWVNKAKHNIDITKDGRGCHGRPKTKGLTLEDYKERYEILKKYQAFLQARREKK